MVWRLGWLGGRRSDGRVRLTVPYTAHAHACSPARVVAPLDDDPTGFVPATMWRVPCAVHTADAEIGTVNGRKLIDNRIGSRVSDHAADGEGMGSAQIGTPDAGRPHTPCDEVAGGAVYLSVVGPVTNAQTPGTQQTGSPGDPALTDGRTRTRAHCDETGINPATRYPRHATDPGCSERWPQTSQSVCNQSGR